jgi:arylformamidase
VIYDISRTIHPGLAVWPGDTTYSVTHKLWLREGDAVNLTTLTMSGHTGSHADAYYHYEDDGEYVAAMPLDAYIGRARLLTVTRRSGGLLPGDFPVGSLTGIQRLLIRSHISELPETQFSSEYPYLSTELVALLAEQGTRLIGLDSPSVDAFDSTDLPCHHALRAHRMVNLETLALRGVPDGDYELIALPLKLDLACGTPVRAILRTLDEERPA